MLHRQLGGRHAMKRVQCRENSRSALTTILSWRVNLTCATSQMRSLAHQTHLNSPCVT